MTKPKPIKPRITKATYDLGKRGKIKIRAGVIEASGPAAADVLRALAGLPPGAPLGGEKEGGDG